MYQYKQYADYKFIDSMSDKDAWTSLNFIQFVKDECSAYGIRCLLKNTRYLREGKIYCAGWFSSEVPALAVAMKNPTALEILVHEYAHMTQWMDGIILWHAAGDSLGKLGDWLDGRRVRDINDHIDMIRELELDNEKRSVRIIKAWNLPIDTGKYIQRANTYIHFYNWLKETRRWSRPTNSPYKNPRVISAMSSKFNMNYTKLSPRIRKIFAEENV
jgi:hypothetical protein